MAIDQNILVTVDAVIFCDYKTNLSVLLIQRKNPPFKDGWALPGGFVEDDEDLVKSCARELEEETGLIVNERELQQVAAFGAPGRDPRGRTVTIAFTTKLKGKAPAIKGADDAALAQWWPVKELPELAFDHQQIIKEAIRLF